MGCPTNCGNRPSVGRSARFRDNDVVKADLDAIDLRSSETLARTRRDFGGILVIVISITSWALTASHDSIESARVAGVFTAFSALLILLTFDFLFQVTRRSVIADVRERTKCADDLCPEVRSRVGFQIPVVLVRSIELDVRWYAGASYLAGVCLTIGLVLSLDPVLQELSASPINLAATAILVSNPVWILVLRRVARNRFQQVMEWECGGTGVPERLFRVELLHTIRRKAPRLEVWRSGFAGATLALSCVGLLIVDHPGEWIRPCFALVIIGFDCVYWLSYSRYNTLAALVHVERKVECLFQGIAEVECPRRFGGPAVSTNALPELGD